MSVSVASRERRSDFGRERRSDFDEANKCSRSRSKELNVASLSYNITKNTWALSSTSGHPPGGGPPQSGPGVKRTPPSRVPLISLYHILP